ncbi:MULTISPECIES: class I SAM-dependent methyltransferase [unclassified Allomuricauda]|uniref:class I SAM-dependent methyltransferase n=1 Tax=unclassified Allomuricauda TaxID=2615049 RepID=UPI00273F5434|nr:MULTISPECIES: class I SAM-dependent methyltransferase [unclassified Allomuricauda]
MNLFLRTKDYAVSGEQFELHRDESLDMLITQPQPEKLSKYYDSEDYISHTDAKTSFTERLYHWIKAVNLKNKIQVVENQTDKPITLLDVGAGTGDFLITAQNAGFKVTGVEPNEKARGLAKEKGMELWPTLDKLAVQKFQAITLWHVLEHLPNLQEQVSNLVELLEDDGVLVIAVPNFKSWDAQHYKSFWAAYDVPRHLWHFSKTAISKLFAPHGLQVVQTKPMWFDAFYVSLLSEKYKGNRCYFITAFFIGLWSNLKAVFTKEPSSLIYILKKGK